MKGDCERASPSPADKRAPKILTRPRAAGSPGPQRRQEQAVPALPAEGSPGGRRRSGEQRRMLINYLPRSALANLPPASLATPGSRCCSDPGQGSCCFPTGSACKAHVARGCGGDGGPSLPFGHPRVQPHPPDTPRGELGGRQGSSPRCLHTSSTGAQCLVLLFFCACARFMQTPGWGRGPWGGGAGCPMGTAQPPVPPTRSVLTPLPGHLRLSRGCALLLPGSQCQDPAVLVRLGTLPPRLRWLLQRPSTPRAPAAPVPRAHLRAARPSHAPASIPRR